MNVERPTNGREDMVFVPYERILIPTDGSDRVLPAIRHGLSLGRAYAATVHTLHVVEASSEGERTTSDNLSERQEWEAAEALEPVIDEAHASGLNIVPTIETGQPHKMILEYAAEHAIELIVIGKEVDSGLRKRLFGSPSDRIIRNARKPVLIVTQNSICEEEASIDPDYADILVPTDGSNEATSALAHGLQIAARYDATLHGLFVVDQRAYTSRPSHTWNREISAWEQRGQRVVADIEEKAASGDVDVRTSLIYGVPHQEILTQIAENDIDLIAMGTRGLTGVDRLLLGSVAQHVMQQIDVPVLTVGKAIDGRCTLLS